MLYSIDFGQTSPGYVMEMLSFVLMFTLAPRFIMNVRELHQCNVIYRQDMGLDTGFGLSSRALAVSAIRFSDSGTFGIAEGDVELRPVGSMPS